MLLCYTTDRRQLPGTEPEQRARLLSKIVEAARAGVDYIQLREKDLAPHDLELLAKSAVRHLLETGDGKPETKLLINSRIDVAIATGAAGVHLTSTDIPASEARVIFRKAGVANPVIGVSCHTIEELRLADSHGADFVVFAPVFEKEGKPGVGLEQLRAACAASARMPVLALGGVNLANAQTCVQVGAAGIAAIRLFQDADIAATVAALR